MLRWLAAPQPDEDGSLTKTRGPMSLDELTSYKWLGIGNGKSGFNCVMIKQRRGQILK